MPELPLKLISDKHLEAIGCVASQWSLLELIIEDCILDVSELPQPHFGRNLTAQMGISQRLDALLSLVNTRMSNSRVETELKVINKAIRQEIGGRPSLQSERNRVIHSFWEEGLAPEIAVAVSFRAYGKFKVTVLVLTPEEIFEIADRIRVTTIRVATWRELLQTTLSGLAPLRS